MHDINSTSRGNALALNRHNSLLCLVRTSRQMLCNQRVGCLLRSMARIYDFLYHMIRVIEVLTVMAFFLGNPPFITNYMYEKKK